MSTPPIFGSNIEAGSFGGGTGPGGVKVPGDPACTVRCVYLEEDVTGNINMNVVGGGPPGRYFRYVCPENYYFVMKGWRITMNAQTPLNPEKFANGLTALAFGIQFVANNCEMFPRIKDNFDFLALVGDKQSDGLFGETRTVSVRWPIEEATNNQGYYIDSGQSLGCIVEDDLSAYTNLELRSSVWGYLLRKVRNP